MKHEWRKKEKELYLPKSIPTLINIPQLKYLTITGEGNPNGEDFKKATEALYALSYAIKMSPKKDIIINGYFEYTVYPLEGVWSLSEEGKKLYNTEEIKNLKDYFTYKLMIRQPNFVSTEVFSKFIEPTHKKKKNDSILKVKLEEITEGPCIQYMHIGSYDSEVESFQLMEDYAKENNLTRLSKKHREIYLSDPRKVSEEKLKTVLRFKVK